MAVPDDSEQQRKSRVPTPAMRAHLAELFDAGNKQARQENYDNACELYT